MKKVISALVILTVIVIGGIILNTNKPISTKVPFNNGFYVPPYKSHLPLIKP